MGDTDPPSGGVNRTQSKPLNKCDGMFHAREDFMEKRCASSSPAWADSGSEWIAWAQAGRRFGSLNGNRVLGPSGPTNAMINDENCLPTAVSNEGRAHAKCDKYHHFVLHPQKPAVSLQCV